mgnify:CR=1 FL=1
MPTSATANLLRHGGVLDASSGLVADALYLEASAEHQRKQYDASLALCRAFLKKYADHESAPRVAIPFVRPLNIFLNLTRFGLSMLDISRQATAWRR